MRSTIIPAATVAFVNRSTTMKALVHQLRDRGGAREVHVRVACPPIIAPCFYGIDMSSVTELFAPSIHKARISGMLENYDFISDDVMAYFKRRLTQAPRDADFALEYVKQNARTPEAQQGVLDALRFKTQVLWAQLDALHLAYVEPGMIPPGAFVPGQA